tara:strand:+ start:635 stop:1864 length:1230 start_codon:yes stop_codon:yes gene_type:complete
MKKLINKKEEKKINVGVIGLGYVGLPIFLCIKNKFETVGFDINSERIRELNNYIDRNKEFKKHELKLKKKSKYSNDYNELKKCNFYIISVPTPVFKNKKPDLRPLYNACNLLKKVINNEDIIFFESTVFPGLTRSLKIKFFGDKKIHLGYSPERINPGDKINTVKTIKKIVAFDSKSLKVKKAVLDVYKSITKNIILSNSVENAEMSKVIENIQRDINIAFMNEILMVCKKLKLDFIEVIKLAKTKWNFLSFSPGLVGGHCLPVDPFYLYHLAKKNNYNAKFMLSGRLVNDQLSDYVEDEIKNQINSKKIKKILILGVSYKANVADLRNSLALQIYLKLKKKFKNKIFAFDTVIDKNSAQKFKIYQKISKINNYDLIVPLVNHTDLKNRFLSNYILRKDRYLDFFNYFG